MTETTVTVGETEVEITETEDGFEATPVNGDDGCSLYIRGEDKHGAWGFEIPINKADRLVVRDDDRWPRYPYLAAWDPEADVSGMGHKGTGKSFAREHGLDGYAALTNIEIVER